MIGKRGAALAALLLFAAASCEDSTDPQEDRTIVNGTVADVQSDTRLFFYDENLEQLGALSVRVEPDGTFGPLSFEPGTFFGAATDRGFTSGEFLRFEVPADRDTADPIAFDLDAITVPLAVGNRWTYDELLFSPARDTLTLTVEVLAQQPGQAGNAVFTVEERRADPSSGAAVGTPVTYFLSRDQQGIRRSPDATIDGSDELVLVLPAALGSSWTTIELESAQTVQKRITGFTCDEDGCAERNDFTIAQEPAGIFMSVSEVHSVGDRVNVTTFSDIGIVDQFVQQGSAITVQRRLRSAQLVPAG